MFIAALHIDNREDPKVYHFWMTHRWLDQLVGCWLTRTQAHLCTCESKPFIFSKCFYIIQFPQIHWCLTNLIVTFDNLVSDNETICTIMIMICDYIMWPTDTVGNYWRIKHWDWHSERFLNLTNNRTLSLFLPRWSRKSPITIHIVQSVQGRIWQVEFECCWMLFEWVE